jgi:hypothetical protein
MLLMIFFNHVCVCVYIYIYIYDKKLIKKYYLAWRKKKVMYKWNFFLQSLSAEIYKESTIKIKKII